jgi:type I restriction enzyme, S subunit
MAKVKKEKLPLEELLEEAIVKEGDRPYEVPGNWVWTKVGKILYINPQRVDVKNLDDSLECSFIPMNIVDSELGVVNECEIKPLGEVRKGYTNFIEDDVIFAKITPCMENRKSAIVPKLKNNLGYGSTEFHVFRTDSRYIYNKFIFYFVRSYEFISDATYAMTGAVGQQRVPKGFIEEYKIPLPPFAEQQRIVEAIESLFEKLDTAKELVQNALDSFENRISTILEQAIRGHLTGKWRLNNPNHSALAELENLRINKEYKKDINDTIEFVVPETWQWASLGDLIDLLSDYHANGSYETLKAHVELLDEPSYACMIRTTNFEKNNFDTLMKYITKEAYEFMEKSKLFGDEILINKIGNAGSVYFMPKLHKPASLAMNLFMLRLNENVSSKYVYYHLLTGFSEKDIKQFVRGVTTKSIDKKSINSLKIALPPFAEQKEIVRILDNLLENEQRAKELSDVIEKIELMKKAILARAFHGELGTNNPVEESAVELLKEVLKEKI